MERHDREIQEQMDQENTEARAQMEQEQQRNGDAVGTDGCHLYTSVWQPGEMQQNFGNTSRLGRQQYGQRLEIAAQQKKVPAVKEPGPCSIVGCTNQILHPDHPCKTCGFGVHNLCAQEFKLKGGDGEDSSIFYCSLDCKSNSP